MPMVRLEVGGWLRERLDATGAHRGNFSVSIPEGETILGMARQLAAQNEVFRKIIFKQEEFGANVLVILNGIFVNPQNRAETLLKDGDEMMLLPVVDGG
jgi:sulfur carrier protein ThiS